MSDIEILKDLARNVRIDLNLDVISVEDGEKSLTTLANAINALEQKGALERVRERVAKESSCGVMRSMPMTDRANAMKDVLAFIDHELNEVSD